MNLSNSAVQDNLIFKYFGVVLLILLPVGYFWIWPLTSSANIEEEVEKGIAGCAENKGANKCYLKAAERLLDRFDYKDLLDSFRKLESDPLVFANCHEVLHHLGRLEYKKVGDIKEVMSKSSPVCFSGAYHGALEEYLGSEKIDISDTGQVSDICGAREKYSTIGVFDQCLHGLGHALISVTDGDLNLSLHSCDLLKDTRSAEQCQSGLFMEIFNSSTNKDHPWNFFKESDPFYPCNTLAGEYQKMCYTLLVPRLFHLSKNDWQKSVLFCSEFPEEYRDICFHQFGSTLVGNFQDQKTIGKSCVSLAKEGLKKMCLEGVVNTYAVRYAGNSEKILDFCLILDAEDKKTCYQQMSDSLTGWMSRNEVNKECEKVPADYRNLCFLN